MVETGLREAEGEAERLARLFGSGVLLRTVVLGSESSPSSSAEGSRSTTGRISLSFSDKGSLSVPLLCSSRSESKLAWDEAFSNSALAVEFFDVSSVLDDWVGLDCTSPNKLGMLAFFGGSNGVNWEYCQGLNV
jgi:hypothetical protein